MKVYGVLLGIFFFTDGKRPTGRDAAPLITGCCGAMDGKELRLERTWPLIMLLVC